MISPSEVTLDIISAGLEALDRPGQTPRDSGSLAAVVLYRILFHAKVLLFDCGRFKKSIKSSAVKNILRCTTAFRVFRRILEGTSEHLLEVERLCYVFGLAGLSGVADTCGAW